MISTQVVTEYRDYHLASYGEGSDAWIARIHDSLETQASRQVSSLRSLSSLSLDAAAGTGHVDQHERGCSGWLWKQGAPSALLASPAFKKRYAVLKGIQLFYYRDVPKGPKKTKPPAGVVRCRAARPVDVDRRHPGKFAFDVDADTGRTFHIFVDDEKDRDRWLSALNEVIMARDSHRHIPDA